MTLYPKIPLYMYADLSVQQVYTSVPRLHSQVPVDPSQYGDTFATLVSFIGSDRCMVQFTSGVTTVLYLYQILNHI